jgi:hypothetical protein
MQRDERAAADVGVVRRYVAEDNPEQPGDQHGTT